MITFKKHNFGINVFKINHIKIANYILIPPVIIINLIVKKTK